MTYDINTISQSDLLKLLLSVKEQYSIDAIDGEKAKDELEQQEKALLRRKQLENEIAKSGFSRNEILDYISVKNGKELFSAADESDKEPKQIFGHFLYEGELSILFGDAGVGKSILAYDIAFFATGGGHDWEGLESPNIPTLYIDLGMSSKQFVGRYKTAEQYIPNTFHRAMIDPTELSQMEILPEVTKLIVRMQATENPPKFIIVDNITTCLGPVMNTTKMKKIMAEFKNLKDRFDLTILLLANCPKKRKPWTPIIQDNLGGWQNFANFFDSSFALGQSRCGKPYKYIKQVKTRESHSLPDVMSVKLTNDPFLHYQFLGYNGELAHLDGSLDYELEKIELSPEQEATLTNMLRKGEHTYMEIADFLDLTEDFVIKFAIENRL